MSQGPTPVVESALMEAVRAVIVERGYQGLTLGAVAAESEFDRTLVERHYADVGDVVASFLAYERDRFVESVLVAPTDPALRLRTLLDALVGLDHDDEVLAPYVAFQAAALTDERISDALDALEQEMFDAVVETVEDGVAEGSFEPVDPASTAAVVLSVRDAALRRAARGADPTVLHDALDTFVLDRLRTGSQRRAEPDA
ncbi:TetR/AcrR family transcriptional regulator [Haloarchaeobius sp. HRN-SO-5]|uniref:TetR/AcrR family transcriptional regulator n=1 Tax=Haloarchaeobius sp. HRN-SO-5 TaxID=3446118 RepID=UPI003EBD3BEB